MLWTDHRECEGSSPPLEHSVPGFLVLFIPAAYFHILCGSLLVNLPQGQAHGLFTSSFWARLRGGLCSPVFSAGSSHAFPAALPRSFFALALLLLSRVGFHVWGTLCLCLP